MSIGRGYKLMNEINRLSVLIGREISNCIITNERGLIVASLRPIGPFEEKLAAMASLLSETGKRVASNIELGDMHRVVVGSFHATLIMQEFPVKGRSFRIILVMPGEESVRHSMLHRIFRARHTPESGLAHTIEAVTKILEE